MDFRTRLREQIDFSGMLDKEVAAKAGIAKRTIDSYVGSQACMPSADVAVRLAKVLKVSVEYLVTGEDSAASQEASEREVRGLIQKYKSLSQRDRDLINSFITTMLQKK